MTVSRETIPTELEIQEYARLQAKPVIDRFTEIICDPEAAHADVIRAGNALLDRGYGRPWTIQPVETDRRSAHQMTDDELWKLASLLDGIESGGGNAARKGNGKTPSDSVH